MNKHDEQLTDFGFQQVPRGDKTAKVTAVFDSVARRYDVMNDLMSLGLHRVWKRIAIDYCKVRAGQRVLDLAGGSGDLSIRLAPLVGEQGQVILADINESMLQVARERILDQGLFHSITLAQANAEDLPFANNEFDCAIIGFGLRNVTDKASALAQAYRVLKPGGRLVVLEFSKTALPGLKQAYDFYSFQCLPRLGQWVADDGDSYRYLAESIRMHPDQDTLKQMLLTAGFDEASYHNLLAGIVAIHIGRKY